MYALLQVLQCSWYILLGFVLVALSVSCWCIVFVVRKAIFRLVCLKRLVTFHINRLWYVNVTHFLFCCVVGGLCLSFLNINFVLQIVNNVLWKFIFLGCCEYDFPFLLFCLFCDR